MDSLSTKAIVLGSIKYSDSSLIVKCFTQQSGLKSYLIKGILKSKKGKLRIGYFQPFTQLQIEAIHKQKTNLHLLKEARVLHPYTTIYKDVVKQSIVLFLSEVLASCIQEEGKQEQLYTFIENALLWFDEHDRIANFHLLFLINLTRYLGFYPDVSQIHKNYFNLVEGNFTDTYQKQHVLFGEKLNSFKKLLGINFDAINQVDFNKKERQIVLKILIHYFELHLEGFKKPKSLAILETVFS